MLLAQKRQTCYDTLQDSTKLGSSIAPACRMTRHEANKNMRKTNQAADMSENGT